MSADAPAPRGGRGETTPTVNPAHWLRGIAAYLIAHGQTENAAEAERLAAALARITAWREEWSVQHGYACASFGNYPVPIAPCDCGADELSAALAALASAPATPGAG